MNTIEKQRFVNLVESVLLTEMPMVDGPKLVGNFTKNSGFKDDDRKLLTNPKAVEKIVKQWENTPFDFDVYMLNLPKVNKTQFREKGEVSLDYIRNQLKLSPEEVPDNDESKITVLFTGNFGAEKVPMTGWMIAHRFAHSMTREENKQIAKTEFAYFTRELTDFLGNIIYQIYNYQIGDSLKYYDYQKLDAKHFFNAIGTMASARNKKIVRPYEFTYELIAQWLLTGSVKLQFPQGVRTKKGFYRADPESLEMYTRELEEINDFINQHIEALVGRFVGKILVM
jgi:hypothetical protein